MSVFSASLHHRHRRHLYSAAVFFRFAHWKPQKPVSLTPPLPPRPPSKPVPFTFHEETWIDNYSWMSDLRDKVAMRHMDVYMEQEEKYIEAVMMDSEKLQRKLQVEMASRMAPDLSTVPIRWGPWLYYKRIEQGKQYPVLCRRLASLNEEFVSYSSPSVGFDFATGKKIEQKLLDYNKEAERFGGYAYEELSEVSPDHRFLAYTMYDKDHDYFVLSVRDMNMGSLCSKPHATHVSNLAWAMDGKALLYAVTDKNKRPYRIFCSMLGSGGDDILIMEESDETVYINLRNSKDFRFITVNAFSNNFSKVYLINALQPLGGMTLIWECGSLSHCIVEHHRGYLYLFTDAAKQGVPVESHYLLRCSVKNSSLRTWETVFDDDPDVCIEDVDFCDTHMVLTIREGKQFKLCSITLPLPLDGKGALNLKSLDPCFLPLPRHVCQISSGTNYDYYSSNMRFIISSPVMPDATVDYNLSNGKWIIVQQYNILHERTHILYGTTSTESDMGKTSMSKSSVTTNQTDIEIGSWNDLSEFYSCEQHDVSSDDGVFVPLTIVYSQKKRKEGQSPGLIYGHGAYGELLDKRWKNETKSLLDRGWVIAYADVRGGGGLGKNWHHNGRRTKKENSITDYISCAQFLIEKGYVHENKLAGWGYSAGGLLVASAINVHTDLFRCAVLKVPFLDVCNTLLYPILPILPVDYEEFGYPGDLEDFQAIRRFSPYDNIKKGALYPAVLVTSSFNTRFGVWEAAKWVARVREYAVYDPQRPILLNLTTDIVEENRYLQCKESALEIAFLIKMINS